MERHPLDLISLTAGLVFSAAGLVTLTNVLRLGLEDVRWIGPALLVLFGVVLVATSASRRRDGAAATHDGSSADTSSTDPDRDEVSAASPHEPAGR